MKTDDGLQSIAICHFSDSKPQGYKTFFVLVLRLVLRTRSLCSTEYDTINRDYKSFRVRSPLSWIWSTQEIAFKMHEFRELRITKSNRLSRNSKYISL